MQLDVKLSGLDNLEAVLARAERVERELRAAITDIHSALTYLRVDINQPPDGAGG